MNKVVKQHISEEALTILHEEPYFVDLLRDAPEPTGDEPDDADLDAPKIYELVIIANLFFALYIIYIIYIHVS